MAQKVQVLLVCDLHDDETEGTETVAFGFDGSSYEIDLCEQHAGRLRDDLAAYVGGARRAGRSAGASTRRPAAGSKPARASSSNVSEVRDWARKNGFEVNDRGRVASTVLEAYEAAH